MTAPDSDMYIISPYLVEVPCKAAVQHEVQEHHAYAAGEVVESLVNVVDLQPDACASRHTCDTQTSHINRDKKHSYMHTTQAGRNISRVVTADLHTRNLQ